ncbi:hypothetical protein [Dapis sp. BLCC M229]|uniref:hypothetical protein n=1 Tax=Dapis sp. BLCC M229 TaxID=3400188 RepID=UPI003CE7EFBE
MEKFSALVILAMIFFALDISDNQKSVVVHSNGREGVGGVVINYKTYVSSPFLSRTTQKSNQSHAYKSSILSPYVVVVIL